MNIEKDTFDDTFDEGSEPPRIPPGHADTLKYFSVNDVIVKSRKEFYKNQIFIGVLIVCILLFVYKLSVNLVGMWISDDGQKHQIQVHEWLGYKTIYSVGVSTFETVLGSNTIKFKENKDSQPEIITYKSNVITLGDGSNWRKTIDCSFMTRINGVWDGTHLGTHYRLVIKNNKSDIMGSMTEGSVTAHISGKFAGHQGSFTDDLGKKWNINSRDNVFLILSDENKNIEVTLHKLY